MAARLPGLLLLPALLGAAGGPADAGDARVLRAEYPEGPLWQGKRLYFAEMGADRVMLVEASGTRVFFTQAGCGPTAIAPFAEGFVVLCHRAARIVEVDAGGREVRRWERDTTGFALRNPNDASADGDGGVYFSDPGPFARGRSPQGWIMHLSASGTLSRAAGPYWYPNGVHVAGDALFVSEHLRNRVLRFDIDSAGRLGGERTFADLSRLPPPVRYRTAYALSGPDGLEVGPDGSLYVAMYGEGRLLQFAPDGRLLGMTELPTRFLTNVAFGTPGIAFTGAFGNRPPSLQGELRIQSPASP